MVKRSLKHSNVTSPYQIAIFILVQTPTKGTVSCSYRLFVTVVKTASLYRGVFLLRAFVQLLTNKSQYKTLFTVQYRSRSHSIRETHVKQWPTDDNGRTAVLARVPAGCRQTLPVPVTVVPLRDATPHCVQPFRAPQENPTIVAGDLDAEFVYVKATPRKLKSRKWSVRFRCWTLYYGQWCFRIQIYQPLMCSKFIVQVKRQED